MILVYIPERVLQSFSLIPFDRSHLKKSSSDIVLLNFKFLFSSSAGTFIPAHHNKNSINKTSYSTATRYFSLTEYNISACINGIWSFSTRQQGFDEHSISSFKGKLLFPLSQHLDTLLLGCSIIFIHCNNVRFCQLQMEAGQLPVHTVFG